MFVPFVHGKRIPVEFLHLLNYLQMYFIAMAHVSLNYAVAVSSNPPDAGFLFVRS